MMQYSVVSHTLKGDEGATAEDMIAIKDKCGAYVLVFWDQRITKSVLPDAQKHFERLGLDTYKKKGQWTEEGKKKYEKDIEKHGGFNLVIHYKSMGLFYTVPVFEFIK